MGPPNDDKPSLRNAAPTSIALPGDELIAESYPQITAVSNGGSAG
jgi:hypothetical protein